MLFFKFKKVLLTTSCTDALEMAAILLNIKEGDEVIMPAYTLFSDFLIRLPLYFQLEPSEVIAKILAYES